MTKAERATLDNALKSLTAVVRRLTWLRWHLRAIRESGTTRPGDLENVSIFDGEYVQKMKEYQMIVEDLGAEFGIAVDPNPYDGVYAEILAQYPTPRSA